MSERLRGPATYAVLMSAVTAFALLQAMVIPVLPAIQHALHADARSVSWVVSAYLLAAAVATPIVGRLGDVYGKKRTLVTVLAVLSVASLVAAYAPSLEVMVAARVLQGVGGGVMPLSLGIVRDEFSAERTSAAVGTLAALGGIGASVGLVLAGPLVDLLGYRALFLAPMTLTAITAVVAAIVVPRSPSGSGGLSWLPAPFLSLSVAAFLLATTQGTAWGWLDPRTLGLYGAAVVVGALWVRLERRAEHPVIDLDMLRLPAVRSANVVSFLLGLAMFGVYSYVPQLLQTPRTTGYGLGATVSESGLVLAPMAACVFLGGIASARLTRRYGPRRVVIGASIVMALSLLTLVAARSHAWEIALTLTAYGFTLGVNLAALSTLVVVSVDPGQTAVASAVNFNVRNIGGAVGAAAMATVVTAGLRADGLPQESGYVVGFVVLAATMLVASVLAMALPRTRAVAPAAQAPSPAV
ncbi:MFS transporter [Mumia zhuanghuii]|uniref:MFS transporter n=2 Tax=Mumia TaxID=1546255 RepID=A0ABW1QJF6_9ACTN|nr:MULTISPECIES: MFS transporter [Mumia]KAA1423051.1 MFS transporter [Mumia zhuanghuii]